MISFKSFKNWFNEADPMDILWWGILLNFLLGAVYVIVALLFNYIKQ